MSVSRREFMQTSGAVVVYFSLGGCEPSVDPLTSTSYDNRITIYSDGSVELLMGKVELGQGIGTALAQIAADELSVAFETIRLVGVDTDFSPDESYTFSSISIQQSGPAVRAAAPRHASSCSTSRAAIQPLDRKSLVNQSSALIFPGKSLAMFVLFRTIACRGWYMRAC